MSESQLLQVDSPYSGAIVVERPLLTAAEVEPLLKRSAAAQRAWARTSIAERVALCERFIAAFVEQKDEYATEISLQMGKPITQARREVDTMVSRARYMTSIAEQALADEHLPVENHLHRRIAHEPLGVVIDIAAWNYPLLIAVNVIVPAVLAGNSVVVKHSSRTPRCGEQFAESFQRAGAPDDLVLAVHANHAVTEQMVAHPLAGYVSFTGSVYGGARIQQAAARTGAGHFIDVGLELGGKDPAYVAPDCRFDYTVENVVDGAFYNTGQSCCAVERVYVHASIYDRFVEAALALVKAYQMGDPLDEATTLGPLAQPDAIQTLCRQVEDARNKGARVLCGGTPTQVDGMGRFFDPALVVDTRHDMQIAWEESFGPVLAVTQVKDDDEAIRMMNDSPYGLTASIWSEDPARADRIARQVQAGTVYQNRCDFLDPALPWVGVKDSGRGCSLSRYGFHHLTRLKSYHYRVKTG